MQINLKIIPFIFTLIFLILMTGCAKTPSTELDVDDLRITVTVIRNTEHELDNNQNEITVRSLSIHLDLSKRNSRIRVELSGSDKLIVNVKGTEHVLTGILPRVFLTSEEVELDEGPLEFSVVFERQNKADAHFNVEFPGVFFVTEGSTALSDYSPNIDDLMFAWDNGPEGYLEANDVSTIIPCINRIQQKLDSSNILNLPSGSQTIDDRFSSCIPGFSSQTDGFISFNSLTTEETLNLPTNLPQIVIQQLKKEVINLGTIHL